MLFLPSLLVPSLGNVKSTKLERISSTGEAALFNAFPHLKRILAEFDRFKTAAIELRTPNPEDDEFIRCGIIGFAQNSPLGDWNLDHFEYVRTLRDEVSNGDFSTEWRRFTSLAAGYILGMRVAGLINDADLRLSEAHTPGFMWLHCEAFNASSDDHQPS
jgi:hypothetical protein